MNAKRLMRARGYFATAIACGALGGCVVVDEPSDTDEEEGTGEAAEAIAQGMEDTGDALRQVVQVSIRGTCSGTLVGPQTVLLASHCVTHLQSGCQRFTYDEDSSTSYRIIIPPAGTAAIADPGARTVAIDGIKLHPAFTRSDYASKCCTSTGGDPVGCTPQCFDAQGNSQNVPFNNKMHDIAVVHLAEPVTDITPSKVLMHIGPRATSIGRYPVSVNALVGRNIVIAGTSTTTQHPNASYRAYALTQIFDMTFPSASNPIADVLTGAPCDNSIQYGLTSGKRLQLTSALGRLGTGGCSVRGDSGGPAYFNKVSLGGTAFPAAELVSSDILVAGVDSSGQATAAGGCPSTGISSNYTPSWNFNYVATPTGGAALNVAGTNGTFVEHRLKDFDGDGVFDADDNCPIAKNANQANCNADAEDAKLYPRRGDACDPVPCPNSVPRKPTKTLLNEITNGPLKTKVWKSVQDEVDVTPLASSFYGNGAGHGVLRPAVNVGSVVTKYRFCQPDSPNLVFCDEGSINDAFVDPIEGPPDPSRPYHRAHVIPNPGGGSGVDNEPLGYVANAALSSRRWKFMDDSALWVAQGWVNSAYGCGAFGACYTGLNGRFWSHAGTTKGRFSDRVAGPANNAAVDRSPTTTGYRINDAGHASAVATENGSHLANHYFYLMPDSQATQIVTDPVQIVTILPWWCDILPEWDGGRGERAQLLKIGSDYGVMRHDGSAQLVNGQLTSSAGSLLASTSIWGAGAEVMREQGSNGFQAVTFAADGRNLTGVVGITAAGLLGTGSDLGFSVPTNTGPGARTGFTPVYSRFDDLAFIVGGTLPGGGQAGDIWMRQVRGSIGWANITPAGLGLGKVLAATYSFRDAKLWIVDEPLTGGTRRLIRVAPFSDHAEVVYAFTKSSAFTKQWLVLDVEGNVVLASSGTSSFGIARFDSAGLHPLLAPTVAQLETRSGELGGAPVIDGEGNAIIVRPAVGVPWTTERRTALQGGASAYAALDAIL